MSRVVVIGAGIVGLATAVSLAEQSDRFRITVLEKEPDVARHQSGRNSGVLHSGAYYDSGSLKARLCTEGRRQMVDFCRRHRVPVDVCGKVIVAVDDSEARRLETIRERASANDIRCRLIGPDELRSLEPAATGVQALHVPEAGITDFGRVCRVLAGLLTDAGHRVEYGARVRRVESMARGARVTGPDLGLQADIVLNCAGLHADRIARASGAEPGMRIVPFLGLYYQLIGDGRSLCRNLIYPVPDPAYPFLGVHLTRTTDGHVECGPNAVVAVGREAYGLAPSAWTARDLLETATYSGFLRLTASHWRMGLREIVRTVSRRAFARAVRKLVPAVRSGDIRYVRSGIRAQAVRPDGSLVDDFEILRQGRVWHVCNAPSPAATAALAIGRYLAERIQTA